MKIFHPFLLRMRNISEEPNRRNQYTHLMVNISFQKFGTYMKNSGKNMVESFRI